MKAQLREEFLDDVLDPENVDQTAIVKLTKDIRDSAATLSKDEVRYLVDLYYQLQEQRIRAKGQLRAISATDQPHAVITWASDNFAYLERQLQRTLTAYAESVLVGQWSMSIMGIGGTLAAGLLAHIDIEKAPTSGHIERFGGIDPTIVWNKKEKRPWNAALKVLLWKCGQSFMKVSNNEKDFYGKIYRKEKDLLTVKNERGDFKAEAEAGLLKYGKNTEAYKHCKEGRLPLAQIDARARRKAVKLFVSHWHEVAYRYRYGKLPPKPYIIAIGGHAHYIPPPNNPFNEPGAGEKKAARPRKK